MIVQLHVHWVAFNDPKIYVFYFNYDKFNNISEGSGYREDNVFVKLNVPYEQYIVTTTLVGAQLTGNDPILHTKGSKAALGLEVNINTDEDVKVSMVCFCVIIGPWESLIAS